MGPRNLYLRRTTGDSHWITNVTGSDDNTSRGTMKGCKELPVISLSNIIEGFLKVRIVAETLILYTKQCSAVVKRVFKMRHIWVLILICHLQVVRYGDPHLLCVSGLNNFLLHRAKRIQWDKPTGIKEMFAIIIFRDPQHFEKNSTQFDRH